jgi:hypothetical protein
MIRRAARLALVRGEADVGSGDLLAPADDALSTVDLLARWTLAARRTGCSLQVRQADADLAGVLDLAGLRDVVASVAEVVGEVERGEQLAVDEVVVPDDPVA